MGAPGFAVLVVKAKQATGIDTVFVVVFFIVFFQLQTSSTQVH